MSKQDRQGVRTPADLERKYDFSQFTADEASVKKYGDQINRLNQTLAQFMSSTIATLEVMDEKDEELEASIEQLDGQDFYQSIMIDVSGAFIRLYDSSPLAPKQYKIYGKTIQYGTPIPAAPIEFVSICKYEGIEVTIGASEIDENPQRFVIPILNGFPGIPVEDGGDYTDGDGKHWIADHIDLIKKVYVQRIGAIDSYNGEEITTQFISNTGELSAEATVQYVLPEPIEIDLSNIPELSALHTYKPRSIITNDAAAWQTVTYVADTKTYVDNTSEAEAAAGRVRYDTIQTLEDTEMEQARHNIGAASQIDVTMLTDRVDALGEGGGGGADIEFPITIAQGGTGATTAEEARKNLGIVDDTGWVDLGLGGAVSESTENMGKAPYSCAYRVENGNHVYIAFNCKFTYAGSALRVNNATIPSKYRPEKQVYAFVPMGGKYIARLITTPAGLVWIEWVQNLLSTTATTSATGNWIDGYIDYWI